MKTSRRTRGFTLIETMIGLAILVILCAAVWLVISSVISNDDALRNRVDLQLQCSRALKEMVNTLKQSGTVELNGNWATNAIANADADEEFPYIFTLGTGQTDFDPFPAAWTETRRLANFVPTAPYTATLPTANYAKHTCSQVANTKAEEGLGPSQGLAFRIAKDADIPIGTNGLPDEARRTTATPKGTTTGTYSIQWGNEYHAFTVVYNKTTRSNDLLHLVWDQNKGAKSRSVIATNVSRLIIETKGLPAAPTPMWPLPAGRAIDSGESTGTYNTAMNYGGATNPYPAPPTNPFEIRITLCLAKPDVNNPNNSLTSPKRMAVVWQQANVNMRSIPH